MGSMSTRKKSPKKPTEPKPVEELVVVTVRLEAELHGEIQKRIALAMLRGEKLTFQGIVNDALRAYFKRHPVKG